MVRRLFFCLLLWLLALPLWAEESPFKVLPLDISLIDQFQRPYLADPDSVWLGVRLAQGEAQVNKELSHYKQISSAGIEYPVNDQEYLKFPVSEGVAKAQFVLFKEAAKNPIAYEMVMFVKVKDGTETVRLNPTVWSLGTESQATELSAERRAPHSTQEKAAIFFFVLLSTVGTYVLFGRMLFARMLYNRRMEVSAALAWSNLLVLMLLLVLMGCTIMVVLFPYVVWQQTYWIYVLVMGSFALLELLLYGIGIAVTRT